jgi:tryptophan-rich sensory protein
MTQRDWRIWLGLLISIAATSTVSIVGSAITVPEIPDWYAGLAKPSFTPPNWVFGPVWSTLYLMMAVAAWLVWRAGGWLYARAALGVYAGQLALNLLWSILFFGLHRIDLAALEIIVLDFAIVATIALFRRHGHAAAWLLVPYLIWVGYATALTLTVWQLNR